jgi:hypothetical protein
MEREFSSGQMAGNTKDNGLMVRSKSLIKFTGKQEGIGIYYL